MTRLPAGPHSDTALHRDAAPRDDTTIHRDPAQHGDAVQHGDPARQRDPVPHGDSASRAEVVRREAALLVVVSEVSPLPVPRPIFVDEEAGVLTYRKLPGRPLNLHPVREPARLAAPLGDFLSRLHAAPVKRMEDLVPRDAFPLRDLREEAEGDYEEIADRLPAEERRLVEEFLAAEVPPDPETLTFCHNDLGSEHLLVDVEASAVTGVVDWTDAAIADPAYDLALVYRDLGPRGLRADAGALSGPPRRRGPRADALLRPVRAAGGRRVRPAHGHQAVRGGGSGTSRPDLLLSAGPLRGGRRTLSR